MSTVLKPNVKHIHSYTKSLTKNEDWRKQVYKCSDPHCRSYDMAEKLIGKAISCANCGEPTLGDYEQIRHRNRKLTCLNCSKSPRKEKVSLVKSEMETIFENKDEEKIDNILE